MKMNLVQHCTNFLSKMSLFSPTTMNNQSSFLLDQSQREGIWEIKKIFLSSYLKTSRVTCCFAIATTVFSYILTLWIPMPQKMAKASTKFSSFLVKGKSSNLLTSWNTPKTRFCLPLYLIGMHKMVLWQKLDLKINPLMMKNVLFSLLITNITMRHYVLYKLKVQAIVTFALERNMSFSYRLSIVHKEVWGSETLLAFIHSLLFSNAFHKDSYNIVISMRD